MKIETIKTADLIFYARNAKRHDDAQVAKLAGSIREFGFNNPVLIDNDNGIVAGHGRVMAAQKLGLDKVPCIRLGHLTDTQRRAYILADNRLAEIGGGWDEEMLKVELDALAAEDIDLDALGFGDDFEIDLEEKDETKANDADAEPQIDKAEELRAKWGVELGQLWELGDHRLLCGDSTKKEDVERVLAGDKPLLMVTDPPYNVEYEGNYIQSGKILKKAEKLWAGGIENDNRADFGEWLRLVYDACDAALGEGAGIYVWHPPGEDGKYFWQAWPFDRWHFQVDLVWNKTSLIISRWDYKPQHEPCMYGWKGKNRKWVGPNNEPTVWDIPRQQGASGETRGHPTQKPVECMARPIRNHDSEFVYEPFSGSGTTIIACEQLGRKCRAIEISPAYVAVAIQRWVDATGKEPRKL